ncbi:hypothetical protein OCO_16010 [Mycobacterium intracellulare MOTT-02]|nr:hypothetical protein OCO_16010 [Mycobacterium intracellulare MOTT-02]AFC52881.1 hypothetical protein OCQ_13690 [Mycobacterium paraintracellulare]ARR82196.1 hypothetical protein MOTT27_01375 [Mycobacterium intracellulare subsp. yongonense]ASW94702.1 hypothetical protein CKJ67_08000 [Mycobacterium intracellulare]ASW99775.1 hypothetical protein CKJ58_07445 [Mycobacterium intracellulare subsp. chimaera]ETZ37406.1 hypothetical protein L843_1833 [Mycobacterium intracellulare MIN_061107_1834]
MVVLPPPRRQPLHRFAFPRTHSPRRVTPSEPASWVTVNTIACGKYLESTRKPLRREANRHRPPRCRFPASFVGARV